MPAAYENLAAYLRPDHPVENANESTIGTTYLYRADTSTITTNKPQVGDTWADARPVIAAQVFELAAGVGFSDLLVVTAVQTTGTALGTPALEETIYELDWRPVVKPLEVHPEFQAGGTYELDATARKHILGWKAELDPALKSARKYRQLNSEGSPGSEVTISGNALDFIKLGEIGVEEWTDYMPVWRKRSIYRGQSAPSTDEIGQKESPDGSGFPSGYEWVKSRDSAQRMGRQSRWRRDEEWEGALVVYVDKDEVFPPA